VAHVFEYFYNEPESERRNLDMMARRARLSAELGVTVQSTLTVSLMFEYDIGQRPDAFKAAGVQMFSGNLQFVAQGTDCMLHSINMMKALKAEGVRIVTGTDVGTCNGTGPHTIHDELEWFVKDVGMTPLEALRCATVNSAAHHGESAVSGTLEVGKRSDLVLLNADPSRDIGATRQIAGVMLGNAYLHRAAMDRGLERAKAIFARMPVPAAA
jgi:imidazolonepropionase-like amidohydrolase